MEEITSLRQREDFEEEVGDPLFGLKGEREEECRADYWGLPCPVCQSACLH